MTGEFNNLFGEPGFRENYGKRYLSPGMSFFKCFRFTNVPGNGDIIKSLFAIPSGKKFVGFYWTFYREYAAVKRFDFVRSDSVSF